MSSCSRLSVWLKSSPNIIITIVFISLFTDSLLLTLVDPILPDILYKIDKANNNQELSSIKLETPNLNTSDATQDSGIVTFATITERATHDSSVVQSINLNGRYGYLMAAKGATQFVCNPFVGIIVSKTGYRIPMFIGDIILMGSTVAFAYGSSYMSLFVIRMVQGASSAVTAVTGMGLLASTFTEDDERGKVMGIAIAGISLGVVVGPVYGSLLYQFFGQAVPFLVVAAMVAVALVLQVVTLKKDKYESKENSFKSMVYLIIDPYILIVAGNIFLLNLNVSMVLAFLPLRLIELSEPETWQLGVVVLPTSIGYLLASIIFPRTSNCLARWLCGLIGLVISAVTMYALAFSTAFIAMLVVSFFLGIALGMVSTSMQPIFAHLVDIRHCCLYGNVYAISDMAVCLALFVGPLIGGPLMYLFGFEWMIVGIGTLDLCFSIFSIFLRNPPALLTKSSQDAIIEEKEEIAEKDINFDINEKTALISSKRRYFSVRSQCSSAASNRSRSMTMDLSHVPVPRYLQCMSGAEDLYTSDLESHCSYNRYAQSS